MKHLAFGIALLLALTCARVASAEVTLAGIDVYGSDRFTAADVQEKFGRQIDGLARIKGHDSKASARAAADLSRRIADQIKKEWDLGWAQLSWVDYYSDGTHKGYVIVDVVEKKDRKARMPFRPAPQGSVEDPGGLLAAWNDYSALGWSLFRAGQISTDHSFCPSFFCEWGTQTPELKKFEEKFIAEAPGQKAALLRVLQEDADPAKRADAVYLLGYLRDASECSKLIAAALADPAPEVRSAALKVFADFAVYHKEVFVPVIQINAVLDYPTADDRNKGLAVVAGLADNPNFRLYLINKSAPQILRLLQQGEPGVQETAYAALGILSKEAYDRKDIASWQRWIDQHRPADAAVPSPPAAQ